MFRFSLFSIPYANLDYGEPFHGYLYNPKNTSSCNSRPPPPPALPTRASNNKGSILLLSNFSHCMLERLLLARAAGYDMILSYTEDDTNTTITTSIIKTKFPIALVQYKHLQTILGWVVSGNNTNTSIAVTADLSGELYLIGIIMAISVAVIVVFIIVVVVLGLFVICLCVMCTKCCEYLQDRAQRFDPPLREDGSRYRSRQERIESIELQAQVPLGRDRTKKFPKREYARNDKEKGTTCCICLDDEKKLKPGQEVRELPCQHLFHPSCIDEWLSHNLVCPLCRFDLSGDNNSSAL